LELLRALGALAEPPSTEHGRIARVLELPGTLEASAYSAVFDLELRPYASIYLGSDGLIGGEALDRIAGFWRALKWSPPPDADHLGSLLGLYATLKDTETRETDGARAALLRHSRAVLMGEHLLPWLFPYLGRVAEVADGVYRAWARLLDGVLRAELLELGAPDAVPRHLALASPLPDPRREGADAFVVGLLSPARSGMILLHRDLARAAEHAGIGVRSGGRRMTLTALLSEAPKAAMEWLAEETRSRVPQHEELLSGCGPIQEHWIDRGGAAAALLDDLASRVGSGVLA
jgi:hypothetical protein